MSQFDTYTESEYIEKLRKFLDEKKENFLVRVGFVKEGEKRPGRLAGYDPVVVAKLEDRVNEKARKAELEETTIGQRFLIAKDYKGFTDAQVSKEIGYSRELVRRWALDISAPAATCLPELAEMLDVPYEWLAFGGEENLPANSHIGVRVGAENAKWREKLFSLTQSVIAEMEDSDFEDEQYVQAYLEWAVFNKPELARASRLAGGRWQFLNNSLLFSPWEPIEERGLQKRFWSDEVEQIIQEELYSKHSVYSAYESIKERCLNLGLTEKDFPKRISLHKRIDKEKELAEKFGVDLNSVIAESTAKL